MRPGYLPGLFNVKGYQRKRYQLQDKKGGEQ